VTINATRAWADSSTTALTWDLGNRLTQVVDSISGPITRQWDELDRLQYEQTPQGRIDYTYDTAGRRQTLTVLGQTTVDYNWDNADRLQSLTQGSAVVLLGFDDANRRTSLTFLDGIQASYAYNARDLTGITFRPGRQHAGHPDLHHGRRWPAHPRGRHLGPGHLAARHYHRPLQCQQPADQGRHQDPDL
jgi:YD repeat-containing protein